MFSGLTKILIVDDIQSLRDLLKAYLRRLGFTSIAEAADGKEAIEQLLAAQARNMPYELVISDWNMPNMTGLELLQQIRGIPEWKTMPFILLTTESEKDKVMTAVMSGASNYMVKPVDEQMLKDKLAKVWEKWKKP